MARIIIIDDAVLVRKLVSHVGMNLGHEVLEASTLAEGLALAQGMEGRGPDLILLDLVLPDGKGLEHVRSFTMLSSRPEVLVMSGQLDGGDGDAAARALRSGAWEYVTKPLRVQELSQALAHILAYRAGQRPSLQGGDIDRGQIVGSSPALTKALHALAEAARSDVNVLLMGETGVGKALFAKTLYRNSSRAGQPFVKVDCASLTERLVESHLLGPARGAERAQEGLLLAAHKGTLFLDSVGDLPLSMQRAFLRALELGEVNSDFRLLAATNKQTKNGKTVQFCTDVLYRLWGMVVQIPPLRERAADIPELGRTAVLRFCVQNGMPLKNMHEGCLETLLAHDWPGNVRELFQAMERACLAAGKSEEVYARHLPTELRVAVARGRVGGLRSHSAAEGDAVAAEEPLPTLREWKAKAEEDYVQKLMRQCHADVREAAATAGLSRGHVYELLKKYPAHFRVK